MKNFDDAQTLLLLMRGARVVAPQGVWSDASLLIEGGRIVRVVANASDEKIEADFVLELNGLTIFPGFIDAHIHGAIGVDTMEATADDLARVAQFLASHGVTAWLPTLVPAPEEDYQSAVRAIEQVMREQDDEQSAAGARVLGVHYEGPFINTAQCGALRPPYFRTFRAAKNIDALATVTAENAVQMITVAPEIAGGIELVRELRRRSWVVAIGHTRADVAMLDLACEAGARHLTHFMNAMPPVHHRAPGPVGWGLLRDDVTCDVIADAVHIEPLVLQLILRCKTAARLSLISDSIAPTGLGDGDYQVWNETISVASGRTCNARGNIAGSVITMHDAVRMMLRLGASVQDVARMAAGNPARLIGADHECGAIEEGKRADLVALDESGEVKLTIIGGRVAFSALPAFDADSDS